MKRVFYKILSLLFVSGLINFVALTTTSSDTQAQEKYALVIGISKYPRFTVSPKLKYADKDAINFSNFLQTPQGGGFSKNNIRLLVNEDATLEKINKEIVWIGKQISNKGLVYIFFAGHGMVDDTSQAYFMPYDSEDTSPSGLGIRADLLIENVKTRISRKHLVYFIDACHSGAALVPNGRTRGSNEFALKFNESWDKAYSDQKEKETDIGFLSASANELSYEDDELQQGLFTYYLIKGLRGEAKANASGVISAFALYKYLLDKVQGEAKRKFDANQTPMISPSFNPDFPVAIHPVAAIESVNPTLSTLKFFRSDEGFTPELGKRQYTDRFARNSTKYIHWELGLKHLAPDGILPFTVEAVLYRPDGSINPTTTNTKRVTSTSIAKDATESFHESGAGWKEAGNWIIGVHRVELFISGKMIASGSFEVFEPPVESLNPTLSSLKFFSSEVGTAPELGKRQYTDRFARNSTKYIHWELGLRHLAPDGILAFTIEAVHYRPDGSILPINSNMKALTNTSIAKDATESFHGSGVGWKDAGNWAIGVHRVELSINGKMITSGSFEVFEPPVESVNPTLSTLKFFRSDEGFTQELGKRQYTDRFARNSTKYIHWELGLKHLGPDGILPFTVEAVFYRPDGNINPNPTNMKRLTNTSIAKDATESFHQDGIGWKEAGNWITGVHRVELFISGKMIASGSFEVFEPPVESLNPTLSTLKFFESGKGFMTESGKRQYTDRFARTSTRYINWEMGLKHLAPDGILPFTVEAVFYRPDGSILPINSYTKALTNTSIAKDATESLHQDGTGWDQAGNWAIGVHRVELFINKKMIASGSFVVFEPPVESLNPTLSTLKFFSSEIGTAPELGKRQYTNRFARNSTKYIHWELGLKHLGPDGILSFTVEAVFYRPDGNINSITINTKRLINTSIAKDATESFHQEGIGWNEAGNWITGVHRVELFISGKMIASGSFEVFEPPVESVNPMLSSLKFFSSDKGLMPELGKRQYTDRFARTSTRYINWEMGLKHLAPDGILPFTVEAVFYRPDGSILPINSYTKALTNTSIAKDATESLHQDGTGWDQAGNWAIGVHRVELFINKKMIASGSFVVFEPPVESLNPTLSTLKFFSSEIGTAPELGKRQYTDQFLRNSARYIHWELGLKHLAPDGILAFTIEAVFYRPDGSVLPTRSNMKLVTYTSIAKDATESFHQDGIGWDEVGNWIIGVHRVELFINKKMIASGSFVVY